MAIDWSELFKIYWQT